MKFDLNIEDFKIDSNLDITNSSFVYGEVDTNNLYNFIIQAKIETKNKSFLDMGSGRGNLVIYLARFLDISSVIGIEIDFNRFSKSVKSLELEAELEPELETKIEFIHSTFLDIFLGQYDILYCCNTVFSQEDNKLLYQKILSEFNGYLFLFQFDHSLKPFLVKNSFVRTSWCNKVPIYLFSII